jgi:hypothetical protein
LGTKFCQEQFNKSISAVWEASQVVWGVDYPLQPCEGNVHYYLLPRKANRIIDGSKYPTSLDLKRLAEIINYKETHQTNDESEQDGRSVVADQTSPPSTTDDQYEWNLLDCGWKLMPRSISLEQDDPRSRPTDPSKSRTGPTTTGGRTFNPINKPSGVAPPSLLPQSNTTERRQNEMTSTGPRKRRRHELSIQASVDPFNRSWQFVNSEFEVSLVQPSNEEGDHLETSGSSLMKSATSTGIVEPFQLSMADFRCEYDPPPRRFQPSSPRPTSTIASERVIALDSAQIEPSRSEDESWMQFVNDIDINGTPGSIHGTC